MNPYKFMKFVNIHYKLNHIQYYLYYTIMILKPYQLISRIHHNDIEIIDPSPQISNQSSNNTARAGAPSQPMIFNGRHIKSYTPSSTECRLRHSTMLIPAPSSFL